MYYGMYISLLNDKYCSIYAAIIKIFEVPFLYNVILYTLTQTYIIMDTCSNIYMIIITFYLVYSVIDFWTTDSSVDWPSTCESNADNQRVLTNQMNVYRCTLLLSKLANTAMGSILVPTLKLLCLLNFSVTAYAFIKYRSKLDPVMLILLNCGGSACFFNLLVGGRLMSNIYSNAVSFCSNSFNFIGDLGIPNPDYRDYYRAVTESLPYIRCKVGNFYYMESGAKLTIVDTAINWIVTLVLTY